MKQLKKDFQALARDLKRLTQKIDKMVKRFEGFDKPKKVGKPSAKPTKKAIAKKATSASASEIVLSHIKRSENGIDNTTLQKKTGFDNQKIRSNLYKLRKQGKITTVSRGLHIAA